MLQYITFLIICLIVSSYKNNKIIIRKNTLLHNNNLKDNIIKHDPLYTVISEYNFNVNKLLKDMRAKNMHTIYINIARYTKNELDMIKNISMIDNKYYYKRRYKKHFWIFEDEKFIGSLSEIYSLINNQ